MLEGNKETNIKWNQEQELHRTRIPWSPYTWHGWLCSGDSELPSNQRKCNQIYKLIFTVLFADKLYFQNLQITVYEIKANQLFKKKMNYQGKITLKYIIKSILNKILNHTLKKISWGRKAVLKLLKKNKGLTSYSP